MPVLRTIHFEVHRVDDETRSEWKFIEWFMEVARRNQGRSFPALRIVAVHVFAARSAQMTVCGDWEYALFDSGRRACSDALWRSWAKCVLGRRRTLEMTVYTTDRRGTDFFDLLERTVEASLSFLGRERFLATVSPRTEIM